MKILNGRELAGYIKERQAHEAASLEAKLGRKPRLVIVYDNDSPVIEKYVALKCRYGEDIGVEVEKVFIDRNLDKEYLADYDKKRQETYLARRDQDVKNAVTTAGKARCVDGIIVQLPLARPEMTDEVVKLIAPAKDVDGLSGKGDFDSATATAIHWLLNGYGVELSGKKIAVVGRGRLVGAPLIRMWKESGYDLTVFGHDGDLSRLPEFEIIVTATGVPHLIKSEMVAPGAVIVDAGTASEDGVLVGDVDDSVRQRKDLGAITPRVGGVGPLTVTALFEGVLRVARL